MTPKQSLSSALIQQEKIESRIFLIRGQRVMLDRDLADLYGVETKYLNRQVKRNIDRFPKEFSFQLTAEEKMEVVTNWHHLTALKFSRTLPYAFTEHGVAMLATILKSERAVKISIHIVKTFIRLKEFISTHKELAQKIKGIVDIIKKRFVHEPEKTKPRIGIHAEGF